MKHTEITKQKLSAMRQGRKNPFYGHKHTEKTRTRIAERGRTRDRSRQTFAILDKRISLPTDLFQVGYLVGLLDGEGSFRFRRKRPYVAIYNTSTLVMNWLKIHIGGHIGPYDKRGREICYTWSVDSARDVYALAVFAYPYLLIKTEDCLEVIHFLEQKYGKERLDGQNN